MVVSDRLKCPSISALRCETSWWLTLSVWVFVTSRSTSLRSGWGYARYQKIMTCREVYELHFVVIDSELYLWGVSIGKCITKFLNIWVGPDTSSLLTVMSCLWCSGLNVDDTEFSQSLTAAEHKIYTFGVTASRELYTWKTREAFVIQKSNLLRRKSGHDGEHDRKRQAK